MSVGHEWMDVIDRNHDLDNFYDDDDLDNLDAEMDV